MSATLERGSIQKLDGSGDTKTTWNPNNADEVAAAKELFDNLKAKRYRFYRAGDNGETGDEMTKFDPRAARYIAVGPIAAG